MTTISVIVPTYNMGHFIGEALESILKQTRSADEIVVVDDGSTDDTARVVAGFGNIRLRYVYQQNAGLSGVRNTALSLAVGDFIGFLDADDRWNPEMLEQQAGVLESDKRIVCSFTNFTRFEHGSGVVLGDQFHYYDLSKIPSRPGPLPDTFIINSDPFSALLGLGIIPAYTQVMLFRRSAIIGMTFKKLPAL